MASLNEKLRDKFLHLSKIDVVNRQLGAAIDLHFAHGDPITIFTLGSAAHALLRDIAQALQVDPATFRALFVSKVSDEERRKKAIKELSTARNFCNHARDDAERTLQFNLAVPEWELLNSVLLHRQVTGERHPLFDAFEAGWCARNPDIATDLDVMTVSSYFQAAHANFDRRGFLQRFVDQRSRHDELLARAGLAR